MHADHNSPNPSAPPPALHAAICCALGLDQPWNTADVIRKLVEAAEILLNDKSYDGHGWEEIAGCVGYAKDRLPHIHKLTAEYFQRNATAQTPARKTMNKPQDPEAAETVQTTSVTAVDLPRLVRPSSLRRFSPKELDDFQEWRKNRPVHAVEREDVPHIVFPKGARFVSDFPMTHDEIKAVSDLMFAGQKMREASDRLLQVLPPGAWHQFFGNWELLKISNRESSPLSGVDNQNSHEYHDRSPEV